MNHCLKLSLLFILVCCLLTSCGTGSSKSPAQKDGGLVQNLEDSTDPQLPNENEAWLAGIDQYGTALTSITSSDFDDLLFLRKTIGDRRLVQLGESGHGVAEFNQVKVRLIRFLHEEMGFNVIAFESGLAECFFADLNAAGTSPRQMIESIFRVWKSEEVLELFEYLLATKESDNPLTLAGFDFQMSDDWSYRRDTLHDMISSYDQPFARRFFATDSLFAELKKPNDIDAMRKYVRDNEADLRWIYTHLRDLLSDNMDDLSRRYESTPLVPLFAYQTAVSMVAYLDFWMNEEQEMQIRDQAMADNVEFLLESAYPNEKIIVWAHNFHIMHPGMDGFKGMGTLLYELFPEQMYTIGLYMFQGQAAYVNGEQYEVEAHARNSLESILHAAGAEYLFVDMLHPQTTAANDWMVTEILTKSWGMYDERLIPREQYHALILIDTVTPPIYLE